LPAPPSDISPGEPGGIVTEFERVWASPDGRSADLPAPSLSAPPGLASCDEPQGVMAVIVLGGGAALLAASGLAGAAGEARKGGTLRYSLPADVDFVDPAPHFGLLKADVKYEKRLGCWLRGG
jgi:hypothetical protein